MWTTIFKQTTSRKGVGTLTAINGSFSYTDDQVNTNDSTKVDEFVTRAKNKFANYETAETEITTIETAVATKLNL